LTDNTHEDLSPRINGDEVMWIQTGTLSGDVEEQDVPGNDSVVDQQSTGGDGGGGGGCFIGAVVSGLAW
jgi:hypothetical protein